MCVWWGVGGYREGDRDEFLLSKSKAFSFKNCILFFFAIKKLNFCWQKFQVKLLDLPWMLCNLKANIGLNSPSHIFSVSNCGYWISSPDNQKKQPLSFLFYILKFEEVLKISFGEKLLQLLKKKKKKEKNTKVSNTGCQFSFIFLYLEIRKKTQQSVSEDL